MGLCNTNKSKFTDCDLKKVRKDIDSSKTPKQARKENRELRDRIKRRTRSREKDAFDKLIRDGEYDEVQDFWKK